MSQKIRIKLKSYDHNLVDKSAEKIVKTVKSTGAVVSGPIPLPTHKKIYTVLRSQFVNENGKNIPCTVLQVGPCVVSQIKIIENDGYYAVQLGFDDKKEKHTTKAELGHFKKVNTIPKRKLIEFNGFSEGQVKEGEALKAELFRPDNWVDVRGWSKGKGFQGVVGRHGFKGVGGQTHGQHNRGRAPGSMGASSFPSRVLPGMRMAGHMGGKKVMY